MIMGELSCLINYAIESENPSNIFEEIGFIIIKPVVHSSMSHAESPI